MIIFGSTTPAGQRLKQMTGVAAILRYPMQGLDDIEEDSDVDSEEERIRRARGEIDSDEDNSESASSANFDSEMADKLFDPEDMADEVEGMEPESPMVDGSDYDLVDEMEERKDYEKY